MKRNIVRISLALVLILSLCLSIGSPAIAAKNDNKPVAWVTWSGSNRGGQGVAPHIVQKFHVKKLADGSVVGDAHLVYLKDYTFQYELIDAYFAVENGNNVAYLLVTMVSPWDGNTYFVCWRFVDGGEPAIGNDELRNYVFFAPNIDPGLVPWPPQTGLEFFTFPWKSYLDPSGVGSANIQVKITDAYYDL